MTFIIYESTIKEAFSPVVSGQMQWAHLLWDISEGAQQGLHGWEGRGARAGEALSLPASLIPTLNPFVSREEIAKPGRKKRRRRRRKTSKELNKNSTLSALRWGSLPGKVESKTLLCVISPVNRRSVKLSLRAPQ